MGFDSYRGGPTASGKQRSQVRLHDDPFSYGPLWDYRNKVVLFGRLPVPTQGTDTPLYVDMVPLLSLGYHPLHGGGDGEGSSPSSIVEWRNRKTHKAEHTE